MIFPFLLETQEEKKDGDQCSVDQCSKHHSQQNLQHRLHLPQGDRPLELTLSTRKKITREMRWDEMRERPGFKRRMWWRNKWWNKRSVRGWEWWEWQFQKNLWCLRLFHWFEDKEQDQQLWALWCRRGNLPQLVYHLLANRESASQQPRLW